MRYAAAGVFLLAGCMLTWTAGAAQAQEARAVFGLKSGGVPIVERPAPGDVRLAYPQAGEWLDAYEETGMTFLEYVSSDPLRPSPERRTIYLVCLEGFEDFQTAREVRRFLAAFFSLPVRLVTGPRPPAAAYDPERRRYDGDEILFALNRHMPDDALLCAALTDKDMFSGRLSAVFGLAYRDLRACVVSTARAWGDPSQARSDDERLRLDKLVAHEVCHVFGLAHSAGYRCLMNGTMSLSDVDRAPVYLCGPARRQLQYSIGFDPGLRDRRIVQALRTLDHAPEARVFATRRVRADRVAARPTRADDLLAARRSPRW